MRIYWADLCLSQNKLRFTVYIFYNQDLRPPFLSVLSWFHCFRFLSRIFHLHCPVHMVNAWAPFSTVRSHTRYMTDCPPLCLPASWSVSHGKADSSTPFQLQPFAWMPNSITKAEPHSLQRSPSSCHVILGLLAWTAGPFLTAVMAL